MNDPKEAAFPHVLGDDPGMTLRDYFAAHALALIASTTFNPQTAAEWAYRYADAMLVARRLK